MTSDEFDSLAIFVAVVEELRREPFFSEDNHESLSGNNVGVFCHPMFLKSAVLPFRKIWMPSERCAFRKRKTGEQGIRELVFREHPDKRLLQGYGYWFYHHFENDIATPVAGWSKESKQEIIDLWLNTQIAHTGPKNPAKRKAWERDLADFNKCDARIGREKFEFLFRSSVATIGHFYIMFEETLAFPLFKEMRDGKGMKPSFEADFALKYNPYPDPKYKIRFDDAFWHLNRETMKETFHRLLTRQRFSGLHKFLRSLLGEMDDAISCVSKCETLDALLKESKAVILDEHSKPEAGLICRSSTSIEPGRPQAGQIKFDAFDGRKIRFFGDTPKVLGEVYLKFRAALFEARQQQRKPDDW